MTKTTRWMAMILSGVLLLLLCGCDGGETPTDTTTTAATTTSTVASTTVTTTTVATTSTATAATTEAATTTTTVTTTTHAPTIQAPTTTAPVTETPLQFGGKTFTLGGKTFEIGGDPKPLLEFLGEPNEVFNTQEAIYGANWRIYHYDSITVETCWVEEHIEEFVSRVYFYDNTYSFDGVAAGDTVEKLDELVSAHLEPDRYLNNAGYEAGGVIYDYRATKDRNVQWRVVFDDQLLKEHFEELDTRAWHVFNGTPIECIIVVYDYGSTVHPYLS